MVDKIEMSLDDIIKSNKKSKGAIGGGARRGARRGAATQRGRDSRRPVRGAPRKAGNVGGGGPVGVLKGRTRGGSIQKANFTRGDVNSAWKHDMYDGPKRFLKAAVGGNESSKIVVSNLDYGVSDADVRELFSEFGSLKKAAVHYDRSGRSLGTADVVFERRADALKAIKQYDGVPLDGRPMEIQLATSDVSMLTQARRLRNSNISPRRGGGAVMRGGGGASNSRGRRNPTRTGVAGGKREKGPTPTAEELDAELDAYVNDMKI